MTVICKLFYALTLPFCFINLLCTILNNQPVIYTLKKLNNGEKATSISCFHFSALYLKIIYDKLKVLNELIFFDFFYFFFFWGSYSGAIDDDGAKWSKKKYY